MIQEENIQTSDYFKLSHDSYSSSEILNFQEGDASMIDIILDDNDNKNNEKMDEEASIVPNHQIEKKKKVFFLIEQQTLKKNGCKSNPEKKSKKKVHSHEADDNVKTKSGIHFSNFLIHLGNDTVNSYFDNRKKKKYFKNIKSCLKRSIFKKPLNELKYKDIFSLKLSKKNKGKITDESTNLNEYENICKIPLLKEFFEQKYSDVLENYYKKNKEETNNIFEYKTLKIKLSKETKTFYNLLEIDKNKLIKEKFLKNINQDYL